MPTISIDGSDYDSDQLSDAAKAHVTNIQVVDQKLAQLQQDMIILQTARNAYVGALKAQLPS